MLLCWQGRAIVENKSFWDNKRVSGEIGKLSYLRVFRGLIMGGKLVSRDVNSTLI